MNHMCRMAGRPCDRLATLVVRIPGVGDRALCENCWRSLVAMGMDMRRLDADPVSLPEWRLRSLLRDQTGLTA